MPMPCIVHEPNEDTSFTDDHLYFMCESCASEFRRAAEERIADLWPNEEE